MVLYFVVSTTEMSIITCIIYYGGVLQSTPSMGYVGGVCEELKQFDVDYLSVTHLCSHVKSSGFNEPERFLYKFRDDPFENTKVLLVDKDVTNIIQAMKGKKDVVLQIYAIHSVGGGDKGATNPVVDGRVEVSEDGKGKAKGKTSKKGKGKEKGKEMIDDSLEGCQFEDSDDDHLDLFFEDNGHNNSGGGEGVSSNTVEGIDIGPHWDGQCESDYDDSDTLLTPNASDDEEGKFEIF